MLQMQYLKMWTRDTFRELLKQRRHDLLELGRFNNIKYLLELVEVHHLSGSETNGSITSSISSSSLRYITCQAVRQTVQ